MRRHAVPLALLGLFLVGFSGILHKGKLSRAQTDGQSSSQPQPGAPPSQPPAVPQALFCGLWRVDGNFVANIHIKNLMSANSVQVTPALFMADGAEYDLASVSLVPTAVADVNINQALAHAPSWMESHLSSYGSAALKYTYPAPGVVAGNITMLDVPDSLVFDNGFQMVRMRMPQTSPATQTLEGLWWKRDAGVGGFVSLANTTASNMSVSVQVIGARGMGLPAGSVALAPHATRMLDLLELTASLPPSEAHAGGVRVRYYGLMGNVAVVGGLLNSSEGYSADMPFWPHNPSSGKQGVQAAGGHLPNPPSTLTLGGVGMIVGLPDPSMNFPRDTRFTPYVTLRNTTSKPMMVASVLYLANTGQSQSYSLPPQALAPYETRQVDVAGEMSALKLMDFDGLVNMTYSYTGTVGDLVMAAGSVDETGTYVFQVLAQGITQSWAKEVTDWTIANGYDTLFTLWNASAEAEDLLATIHYADGSGQYKLPLHLEAHASMNIDMAQLIALAQPDANGSIFQLGVQSGSVTFSSPKGMKGVMELAVNAVHYNVANATCCYTCICCTGICGFVISPDPATCPVNFTLWLNATEYFTDGTSRSVGASWSSANTAIATVDSNGLMTGAGAGQTTITAFLYDSADAGQLCGCNPYCGQDLTGFSASATADVDDLTCGATSGSQGGVTRGSTVNCTVNSLPSGGTVSNWKFTDGTNTVTTSSTSSSWSGTAVQSGTVSVTVTSNGTATPLSAPLTVNARTNFAFTAVSPVKVANGSGTGLCSTLLPFLSTPTSNSSDFGEFCLGQAWTFLTSQVSGGPNDGYWYVTSASNTDTSGNATTFQWEIVPDLDNTSSTFYQEQTGTYNSSSDPGGCISGANLATQTARHESGSVEGHWGNYNNAQNNTTNNLGVVSEAEVGGPSLSQQSFTTAVNNALTSAKQNILNATQVEPYPVNYDQNDVFLGNINFPPSYTSCK